MNCKIAIKQNFQELIKLNEKITQVGFPFIGDFHFKDYKYVEPKTGPFKYNYFLFNADLFPSFYLLDNPKHSSNLRVTFGVKIRVWNKRFKPLRINYTWRPSHSIKTPSFLPGIYYTKLLSHKSNDQKEVHTYFELGFTHHSNGQDGPTLVSQDSTLVLPPDLKYNIVDGDFSANNISFKYGIVSRSNDKKVWLQNFKFVLDGLGDDKFDLDDLHKYNLGYEFLWTVLKNKKFFNNKLQEQHKINGGINFGFNALDNLSIKKSLSYSISYHYRLPFSQHMFLFARYDYLGQDDYNIYLEQSLHFIRLGISTTNYKGFDFAN